MEDTDEAAAPDPISPETALGWLAAARPAAVLAVLRDPEFAAISVSAFVGFRVNATGYGNPLVRKRLAQEIGKNQSFAAAVRVLAEEAPAAPTPAAAAPNFPKHQADALHSQEQEFKEQRDQRRRERDEARQERDEARRALAASDAARGQTQAALDEQVRHAEHQKQRVARLERRLTQADAEKTALLRALRQDKVSPPPRQNSTSVSQSRPAPESSAADAWREAVARLLSRGKTEMALAVTLDVLRESDSDAGAMEIAVRAYEALGSPREAAILLRRLFALRLDSSDVSSASQALFHLLTLLPPPPDARAEARRWLAALRSADDIAEARSLMERLKRVVPPAHTWLQEESARTAPRIAQELAPTPGQSGPDDPLPLPGNWTARQIIRAVSVNDIDTVIMVRECLAGKTAAAAEPVWAALARAASEDDSVLAPLRRSSLGAIVVDGSNAAWYDQHSYAAPRPRLRTILALRRTLRQRGWFPVHLYADAPLPYTVDDPASLRAMLASGEIALVDSGVDADEVLLREAKRLGAPLVTNDYMTDWDPNNEVEKIQYVISLNGEAQLLRS